MPARDFIIAALLVLTSNLLFCGATPERPERNLSYRMRLSEVRRLEPEPPIDLVLHGDSRSKAISAEMLCGGLARPRTRCLNLSSTAGDWVTTFGIHQRVAPLLAEDATIVLAVSDFWLEMGGHNAVGLLRNASVYASLGDPLSAVESYLPLSRNRSSRVRQLRRALESAAADLREAVGARGAPRQPKRPPGERPHLLRRNVDQWYREPSRRDLDRNLERGHAVLEALVGSGGRVVLVYLPNPLDRDRYVDRSYPGRRQRFFETLQTLAETWQVPVVDLADALPDRSDYEDYHHLNERGAKKATRLLARALDDAIR